MGFISKVRRENANGKFFLLGMTKYVWRALKIITSTYTSPYFDDFVLIFSAKIKAEDTFVFTTVNPLDNRFFQIFLNYLFYFYNDILFILSYLGEIQFISKARISKKLAPSQVINKKAKNVMIGGLFSFSVVPSL